MANETISLRLGRAQGTDRYFLGDRIVRGGDLVELCCSGGWIKGRFEWDPGMEAAPMFYFSIELDGGGVMQHALELPDRALMRWP
jgi:hypothetical protein